MKIYKFPLMLTREQTIACDPLVTFLSVQVQHNQICLWGLVNPYNISKPKKIYIYGTGQDLPNDHIAYLGTVQLDNFVWHVFEENVIYVTFEAG